MRHPDVNPQRSGTRPDDGDGPLADLTAGVMWLIAAATGLLGLALPGSDRSHLGWALGLVAFASAWGCVELALGIRSLTMRIGTRAWVTAAMLPVVALALWATGGADSYLQPLLLFTALFIAYFFPPRLAWPLVALFVLAYATPLAYDGAALGSAYPARAAIFAAAVASETVVMQMLKRRLVRAEARQRAIAQQDPLTGLQNRRAFDTALADAARGKTVLVLFDFDDFKSINDRHGHPVGDAVLQAVARACLDVAREGDCLARIGGDEFALVARDSGGAGVERLVTALDEAIATAEMPEGIDSIRATFGWGIAPDEATAPDELFRCADERLLRRKRASKTAQPTGERAA
ncbi:MAG: GGDEF domain-containing protein [Thermoleophilaceae bacterium]|nr:GGDEF domain-containing protein [Thermoleophilaceae bacterium]